MAWLVTACIGCATSAAAGAAPATYDTLSVESVLQQRQAHLDSLLLPESTRFDTLGVSGTADSLDQGGAEAVHARVKAQSKARRHHAAELHLQPLALSTYNRIEGSRAGMGVETHLGPALGEVAAAYGFANHRWSGRARLELSNSAHAAVTFEWHELVEPFGPNVGESDSPLLALVAGQDRQDYLRRRALEVSMWPRKTEQASLRLRFFEHRDTPVTSHTDFSLFGGDLPIDEPNPSVDIATTRGMALKGHASSRHRGAAIRIEAGGAEDVEGAFSLPIPAKSMASFENQYRYHHGKGYAWQRGSVALQRIVSGGNTVSFAIEAMSVTREPPLQELPYLGGDANLRGYDRLEFSGRRRASARFEFALGKDLLARTRIPLVERLHLQFIPFVDGGTTWGQAGGVERTTGSLNGKLRSSVGLGLQRTLWIPGLLAARLDIVRRNDGHPHPWSVWFHGVDLDL
jgi:hypothetical protein